MTDGAARDATGSERVVGAAAIAAAMSTLEQHVRTLTGHAIRQQAIADAELAGGVVAMHDRLARHLQGIALEHGTHAMATAAEYAATALEAGMLYAGDELESFLTRVAGGVRVSSRRLTKATTFGT